ncbi:phospholipase D family protein [Agromyces sp. GXQ0307]|uniref:phospholipase D family protein n=1 Tax=Agromyces sp. GXQ0307 TaxID=3377835 RepID=UPI00383B0C1B
MLEPQTRATLTEQLKPPTGFELSHAVGTTFTLDLATALAVPLSFASHRLATEDDTLGVLDAIRRASDRIDVFAQAGEISMGTRSDLVAFLEPMVHPVTTKRGLFHPKVWFLEYRSGDELSYRFLCASRNLTADRSWDVVVRLDGRGAADGARRAATATNKPMAELLRHLPALAVHPLDSERQGRIEDLADRWRSVAWERPESIKEVAFHAFGVRGSTMPDVHGKRALIISPFLSDDGLRMLRAGVRTTSHVISRAESLDRLAPTSFEAKLATYVLDDAATPETHDEDTEQTAAYVPPGDRLVGLHAKAVIVDRQDGAHVFLGSANATTAAWEHNVEVMVELVGPVGRVGVEATLDALGDLKEEYHTEGGAEPDADEEADRRLETTLRSLASVRFTARVTSGEPHGLRVWVDDEEETGRARRLNGTADVSVRWHLLTRPDLGGPDLPGRGENAASQIRDIPLADITPFIALVARDERGRERRTILLARLLDDVPTRREAIIARQLTDRATFVRLLMLLLELSGGAVAGTEGHGFFGTPVAGETSGGVFEALVRALGDGHHGLADARRIIDYLRSTDDRAVLPEGFEELWEQVWAAHVELMEAPA